MPPVSVRVTRLGAVDADTTLIVYQTSAQDAAALHACANAQMVARDGVRVSLAAFTALTVSDELAHTVTQAVSYRLAPRTQFATATATINVDPPIVMGVLNVTPDSFFDGGKAFVAGDPSVAINAGLALHAAGARIVDVGGESTRPGAEPVAVDEELARVVPVVEALSAQGVIVSIDTMKAPVADACLRAGAAIVNDVSAGMFDPDMFDTVVQHGAAIVLMHMQGTPQTMQQNPSYTDVVGEVFTFLAARLDAFVNAGGERSQVVVDPGIGFGKRVEDNLSLLRALDELHALGAPVLVGLSHKSVLGAVTARSDPSARHAASVAGHALAVNAGAQVVRAHDVAAACDALAVAYALRR
ncbi:MAG: dihydropteroate synthase [Nitriliruptoraceae bacterium]